LFGGYFLFGFGVDAIENLASGTLAQLWVGNQLVVPDCLGLEVLALHLMVCYFVSV
jgi:hypothetical protein